MAAVTCAMANDIARRLAQVKHVVLVLSGKGRRWQEFGFGPARPSLSTISTPQRVSASSTSTLRGPSIPRMLGVDGQSVHQSTAGWVPVYADGPRARLACMSVAFLLIAEDESVVWRGPKKNAMIRQFLGDVRWGELDYLVIDTPPGQSHLDSVGQRSSQNRHGPTSTFRCSSISLRCTNAYRPSWLRPLRQWLFSMS